MAGASTDEEAGAIGAADEDAGAIGAADEDAGAAADDDTAAELDAVFTTVVLLPRLKIQMRPMITITAPSLAAAATISSSSNSRSTSCSTASSFCANATGDRKIGGRDWRHRASL